MGHYNNSYLTANEYVQLLQMGYGDEQQQQEEEEAEEHEEEINKLCKKMTQGSTVFLQLGLYLVGAL